MTKIEMFFTKLITFGAKEGVVFDHGYFGQTSDTDPEELAAKVKMVHLGDQLEIVPPCHFFKLGKSYWAFDLSNSYERLVCNIWKMPDEPKRIKNAKG